MENKQQLPKGTPSSGGAILLIVFGVLVALLVLAFVPPVNAADDGYVSTPVEGSVVRLEQLPSSALPEVPKQVIIAQNASQGATEASVDTGPSFWSVVKAKAANAWEATSTKVQTITDAQAEIARLNDRIGQLEKEIVATHSQYRLANAQAGKASEAIETLCAAYHAGGLKLMLEGRANVSR